MLSPKYGFDLVASKGLEEASSIVSYPYLNLELMQSFEAGDPSRLKKDFKAPLQTDPEKMQQAFLYEQNSMFGGLSLKEKCSRYGSSVAERSLQSSFKDPINLEPQERVEIPLSQNQGPSEERALRLYTQIELKYKTLFRIDPEEYLRLTPLVAPLDLNSGGVDPLAQNFFDKGKT